VYYNQVISITIYAADQSSLDILIVHFVKDFKSVIVQMEGRALLSIYAAVHIRVYAALAYTSKAEPLANSYLLRSSLPHFPKYDLDT